MWKAKTQVYMFISKINSMQYLRKAKKKKKTTLHKHTAKLLTVMLMDSYLKTDAEKTFKNVNKNFFIPLVFYFLSFLLVTGQRQESEDLFYFSMVVNEPTKFKIQMQRWTENQKWKHSKKNTKTEELLS